MEFIPVNWIFSRKSILPIINVQGESDNVKAKDLLLGMAVMIIEKSEAFEAKLYQEKPEEQQNFAIRVSFSLIFSSEEKISGFQEFLNHFGN